MYMECPVIAMRSGGPLETVAHDATGFLCDNDPNDVSEAMQKFVENSDLSKQYGSQGKQRVLTMFSFVQYTEKLDSIIQDLMK